jgi:hypothetical protein
MLLKLPLKSISDEFSTIGVNATIRSGTTQQPKIVKLLSHVVYCLVVDPYDFNKLSVTGSMQVIALNSAF